MTSPVIFAITAAQAAYLRLVRDDLAADVGSESFHAHRLRLSLAAKGLLDADGRRPVLTPAGDAVLALLGRLAMPAAPVRCQRTAELLADDVQAVLNTSPASRAGRADLRPAGEG
jgi:hypothetical protein